MTNDVNVCCPALRTLPCTDTEEHQHLFCEFQFTIKEEVFNNEWVKTFCLGETFKECKYYPRKEK